ncbi:hypothetical protein [Brevibacillus laterosporus]|uniref:hypothetical protein n=1 Tax=Brevibacillus laterosporus TaxID=1465 RepID=UPI0026CCAF07
MPSKAKRPCSYFRCPELTTERFCQAHKKQYDQERGSSNSRGMTQSGERQGSYF